ncbi:serine hydrolase domain-containing protein [Robertkochia aurantiaca]|uniref:serine hydrolase domain-containing protein n=1 Tax=Robertkochia aurantiaca TaxID=2873700 RepID=UPI001CCC74BB|nr:serine hydrolase domain-containing protein [Robertkochia sp. 3YJGBD-33]
MKRLPLFTIILFSIFTAAAQQSAEVVSQLRYGNAAEAGLSAERLERVDRMIEEAIEEDEIPGAVAFIARNGVIAYHKAFGTANPETGEPMERDAIFRIASQTKAITATAVMMLWEEGRFRLDDPIEKYITEFENMEVLDSLVASDTTYTAVPAKNKITIRHLLTHTSGLGYGQIDADERIKMIYHKAGVTDLFTTEDVTIEESVLALADLPLHHEPGEKFTYSEGLDVLGYFVEVISGMPLDRFFRERIFDPLGMDDTWFYLPEEKQDRLVRIQTLANDQWENYPTTFYDPDYPVKGAKRFFSGGAGLSSTAEDYARFLQMYLNKGTYNGQRLLSRVTVDFILSNQIAELFDGVAGNYGLAFGQTDRKTSLKGGWGSEGTFYWGGYFNTQYFADPQEELIGIIMKQTQAIDTDDTGWKFMQLTFSAIDD